MTYHSARFAAQRDTDITDWMFDRKVIPLSFAAAEGFSKEYYKMTDFIWPDAWKNLVSFSFIDTHMSLMVMRRMTFRNSVVPSQTSRLN